MFVVLVRTKRTTYSHERKWTALENPQAAYSYTDRWWRFSSKESSESLFWLISTRWVVGYLPPSTKNDKDETWTEQTYFAGNIWSVSNSLTMVEKNKSSWGFAFWCLSESHLDTFTKKLLSLGPLLPEELHQHSRETGIELENIYPPGN